MKKRLPKFGAVLLLMFVLVIPAFGAQEPPASGEAAQQRLYPLLVDDAQFMDETEEAALLAKLEEISARQGMDVAVVTVAHLDGRSVEAYIDDFYDYFGYGQGQDKDGVMLLVAMEEREAHMTAVGSGIHAFTDAGRAYILDEHVMPLLSDGAYADVFNEFAAQCDVFITQARTGKPYDGDFMPKGKFEPLGVSWLVLSVLAGLIVTAVVCGKLKKQMKTVAFQREANNYAVDGSLVLTGQSEQFVTVNTTRTPRTKESGKGSSGHTASSGTTHSGSSRKF